MKKEGFFCASKHHKTEKFLEVAILVVLFDKENYGYGISETLKEMGYEEESFNTSTLYRSLRRMEQQGLVTSDWRESHQGPRKRVYSIAEAGRVELENWIQVLKRRRNMIDGVIHRFDGLARSMKEGE
ncbi:MAG: hypothetical protein AVO33_02550 [delta proteobacterium ML8_F1]|nr:MAG: hypothetical protein AVO33_02550 [delta proteobacterium ML8_F1]